uniref:Uncharacterized protein n=1 Tax=Arundo donax TaxID=35708 RepID=A0A0A9FRL0_ARUDO
MAGPASKRAS